MPRNYDDIVIELTPDSTTDSWFTGARTSRNGGYEDAMCNRVGKVLKSLNIGDTVSQNFRERENTQRLHSAVSAFKIKHNRKAVEQEKLDFACRTRRIENGWKVAIRRIK